MGGLSPDTKTMKPELSIQENCSATVRQKMGGREVFTQHPKSKSPLCGSGPAT
jgi:hypothetical protein